MSSSQTAPAQVVINDWESCRPVFTRLFIEKDKSLKDVMRILKTQYGFKASEKQYKNKITLWGVEKNIRDGDMRVVLRKQLKRKLEDEKESEFQIHGRPVQAEKMERFVKRKGMTEEGILACDISTPGYIACSTPKDKSIDPAIPTGNFEDNSGNNDLFMEDCQTGNSGKAGIQGIDDHGSTEQVNDPLDQLEVRLAELVSVEFLDFNFADLKFHFDFLFTGDFETTKAARDQEEAISKQVQSTKPPHTDHHLNAQKYPVASSPFERWSPRYHLSSTPSWYYNMLTPGNPLSLLTPLHRLQGWTGSIYEIDHLIKVAMPALDLPESAYGAQNHS